MPAASVLTPKFAAITIAGSPCPHAVMQKILSLEVTTTYNRPGLCLFTFDADANTDIPSAIDVGKEFDVAFAADGSSPVKVFQGEITALEFDFVDQRSVFIVQAEDKFHRFFRGDKVATHLKMKVADVAKKIAAENGVAVGKVDSTSSVLPLQMRANTSDGAWLLERAGELGFHVGVIEGKFFFGKVGSGNDSGVQLKLGDKLQSFNARVTANAYAKDVTVRGWDPAQKSAIVGTAKDYTGLDPKVAGAFSQNPTVRLTRTDLGSIDEATASAQAALDRAAEGNRQAEGRCHGDPALAVDKEVTITGVNTRFNGKYRISRLRHTYTAEEGFMTEFSCRGLSDQSLAGLVSETAAGTGTGPDRSVFDGVTVGIVTENNDPEGLGRVKVKMPALSEEVFTDWIRIAFPGGGGVGGHHGWYLLPEVNDEVLVAFEQGDVRRAYVIGGLLNGKEKPHKDYPNGKVLDGGRVNQHLFLTKSGSHLLFDEKDDVVEIANKDAKFFLRYNCKDGVVVENTTTADKFAINNDGNITIKSKSGDILLEAEAGSIKLKAKQNVEIDANAKVAIKAATGDASMEGMNAKVEGKTNAEVKGNVMAKLEGGANATVKGAMVMIN